MKKGSANYDYTDGPTNFGRINPESLHVFLDRREGCIGVDLQRLESSKEILQKF